MTALLNSLYDALSPLWEMSFTAAWVSGVVFLLRLLLKKRAPKRVLCLLWLVVFARLLIPVTPESPVSLVPTALTDSAYVGAHIARPPLPERGADHAGDQWSPLQTHPGDTSGQVDATIGSSDTGNSPYPVVTAPAPAENASTPAVPETRSFPWRTLLAGLWLTGTAGMLGYGIVTYFRLRRRMRFAVRVSGQVWEDETVSSPFILGMFRPQVYLPTGLEGQARQYILCHEFAHLRRLDHIVKPVCWLALAIHWFNPAVWVAFLLLSRDMEGACDEAVLRSLGEDVKAGYSYTLLALASGRRIPAPCPVAFDEGDAKGRIKHVLNYRKPALWIIVVSVLAVVVAAVCLLTDPVAAEEPTDAPAPSEREPGPSQSPEMSPSPVFDEGMNDLLDPWMLEVLRGERTFTTYGADRDIDHLKEAYRSYWRMELGKLAVIDLDKDGANELVIFPVGDDEYLYSVVGYMILRLEGDAVRGYDPGWRWIGDLKEDGTFRWSSSAFEHGVGLAHFDGGEFSPELFTYVENYSCFVEGQPAAQEEFDAAMEAQDAKPEPVWYVFQDGVLKTEDEAWKDTVDWSYSPQIPVDPAVNVSVPIFLSAGNQWLYQRAYSLYSHLFGADTSAIDEWAWSGSEPLPPAEPVEVDGYTYLPSTGLFARWEYLEYVALSVFTPGFWEERNTWLDNDGNPHQTFINVDGRTYYLNGARGSSGRNPYFPDTFHLPEQSDTEISFVLVGYYSEVLREGESFEERDARLADRWDTYRGYPMKLVLTENGWRFDEFHNTDTDNALLPYASQAAPNPALTDDPTPDGGACTHGLDHVYIDRLTDGRLVFRCQEDFFPYYPPYPCAYDSSAIWEGDCDGDGHLEQIVVGSAGTLMLCDVVKGELKTFTLTPSVALFPDADLSTAWIEPGDELVYCVPLRDVPNGNSTGTAEFHLRYDGTALTELIVKTVRIADGPRGRT